MPARQRGWTRQRGKTWAAGWRDENGDEQFKGGFATKTDARDYAERQADEVDALRRGEEGALRRREMLTLSALVEEYLAQHVCEENTKETLAARLKKATATFGDIRLDRLPKSELRSWRATLPSGSAWHIVKALRQVLNYAVEVDLLDKNPAKAIPNSEPKRAEIVPFGTLADVEAVADELLPHYRAIPFVGSLTGPRPEELFGLERRDIDGTAGLLHVRRVLVGGRLRTYGKTDQSLRVVPLPARALEALEAHPARLDTRFLFYTNAGNPVDLHRFRSQHWNSAVRAAGLARCTCGHLSGEHEQGCQVNECGCAQFKRAKGSPTPYSMRHTFASWAIAAGLPAFEIARTMGTSLEQLSRTYGHLLPDSAERARVALDSFLEIHSQRAEEGRR